MLAKELIEFIGNSSVNEVKEKLKTKKINIKQTKKLYIVNFEDGADFSDLVVRQATGVIFEKKTNKPIHISFEKCYDGLSCQDGQEFIKDPIDREILTELNFADDTEKNYTVELYFEGSLIKLFYYDDKWQCATSKHIDASKNYWSSKSSFEDLFIEAVSSTYNNIEYEDYLKTLDKRYCYTYLLQHPENNLSSHIEIPVIYQVNKVNLETFTEERDESVNLQINKSIDEILTDKKQNQNYMIYVKNDSSGRSNRSITRIKYLTTSFNKRLQLRGEYPDIGLSYLRCLTDKNLRDEFVNTFKEYSQKYEVVDKLLVKTASILKKIYTEKYILKKEMDEEYNKNYEKTLVQLHGQYKKTRVPITFEIIYEKLINLEPKIAAYVIGYKY